MIAQILIADDDAEIRSMLKDFLEARGHRVLDALYALILELLPKDGAAP